LSGHHGAVYYSVDNRGLVDLHYHP
jgi:hypothetical protein